MCDLSPNRAGETCRKSPQYRVSSLSDVQSELKSDKASVKMNEHVRNHVYFSTKRNTTSVVKDCCGATLPEIAGSLTFRITDNFQW